MDPEIIDNFLPSSQFEKIQSYMIGDGNFPWFYNNGIVDNDDGLASHKDWLRAWDKFKAL